MASLYHAATTGNLSEVRRILRDPSLSDDNVDALTNGKTALYAAALQGHSEICHQLLLAGASPLFAVKGGTTCVTAATRSGNAACVTAIVKHHTCNRALINAADSDGYTPIMVAAMKGALDCAAVLLKEGADADAQKRDGTTARRCTRGTGDSRNRTRERARHNHTTDTEDTHTSGRRRVLRVHRIGVFGTISVMYTFAASFGVGWGGQHRCVSAWHRFPRARDALPLLSPQATRGSRPFDRNGPTSMRASSDQHDLSTRKDSPQANVTRRNREIHLVRARRAL